MVAVETERVMPSYVLYGKRAKVLNHARALARSGEHVDHKSIILRLAAKADAALVQAWLDDRAFCAQLDKLCAMARGEPWN